MRILLIRAKATMQMIEMSCIVNDDDALMRANQLRLMDVRDEYRIDILVPEPYNYVRREFTLWTK